MKPVELEIIMRDSTRQGMQSVENNINGMETQMQEVISILKKELVGLQDAFKGALSQGVSNPEGLADIQALKGKIVELEEELKSLKKQAEVPVKPNIDLGKYLTDEIKAMESAEDRVKAVIANIQQDINALRSKSLETASTGVINPKDAAEIKALEAQVRSLTDTLGKYDASKRESNATPLMQNDPAPKLNNVKMSMQQIARELPALAMGPQMFFLAISNNIPMFTDAVASARKEYELMTAAGQKATPVWKQLLKSLFSWQTAMAAVITLTVVFGKEIGNFISTLFSGKKAVISLAEAQEELNKTMMNSDTGVGKNLVSLKMLQEKWSSLGNDLSAKKKFISENKDEFDKLNVAVTNVSDAENLLVGNTEAFIKSMQLRARGAAAQKIAAEKYEESLRLQLEIEKEKKRPVSTLERTAGSMNTVQSRGLINETGEDLKRYGVEHLEKKKKAVDDAADAFFQLGVEAENEAQKELKAADIKEKIKVKTPAKGGKTITDYENELSDARIRAQQKLEDARIAVKNDGYLKRKAIVDKEYKETLDAIDKEERDTLAKMQKAGKAGKKITPEEEKQVKDDAQKARVLAQIKNLKDTSDIEKEWRNKNAQAWIEYNKEYGTYQEKRLAIEKEYDLKIAEIQENRKKAQADGDVLMMEQMDIALARATKDKGKSLIALDYDTLKKSPDYIRAFENLRETSSETLNSLLGQFEKAKSTAAQVLSPDQLREYTTTIQEIMDELDSRNPFQTLIDRKKELAEAEEALVKASAQLDAVQKRDAKIETGAKNTRFNEKTGKIESEKTYLSATEALKKYNEAKDKTVKANAKVEKAEKDVADVVTELSGALKEVGDSIGGSAGEIISLIGDIGLFAMTTMEGIDIVSQKTTTAIQAVEKASVILSIISAAIQILQKISELGNNKAFKQYEAYAEKLKEINALTDAVNEYRVAALEAQQAEAGWFSDGNLQNLRDYRKLHDEVSKAYVDKAMESQAAYKNESGGGWLTGAINWVMGNMSALSWWDDWKNIWGQGDYDKGQTAAINNLRIETRKKSSGFLGSGIGGKSQKTEDLVTWARNQGLGELFDDEGMINKELAQTLIDNYGNKLVGETKETLESLIELRKKYDEYIQQLHEYVSSLYEPLVDNFVDSLWDWFDTGKDALDSFKDYASDTFRNIVSDMLRTIVLQKVVGTFSDDISALYEKYAKGAITEEELMKLVAERTSGLVGDYEKNIPALEGIMTTVNDYFKNAGIDLKQPDTSGSSQSGHAGAITTVTEETAGKLEGIGNSIQTHVIGMDDKLMDISQYAYEAIGLLGKIVENTAFCKYLEQLADDSAYQRREGTKLR